MNKRVGIDVMEIATGLIVRLAFNSWLLFGVSVWLGWKITVMTFVGVNVLFTLSSIVISYFFRRYYRHMESVGFSSHLPFQFILMLAFASLYGVNLLTVYFLDA